MDRNYVNLPIKKCGCGHSSFKQKSPSICLYCEEYINCMVCNKYHFKVIGCKK